MKKDTVSVIVPVYNIEAYLPRCLECIKAQTYTNLEIILVDDGSTDLSGRLCDEYAASDTRARVIHHDHNIGLWAARNTGQEAATGDYLWFPDGDDYFHRDIIKIMYEAINKVGTDGEKYDVAIVGYKQTLQIDEDISCLIVPNLVEKRIEEIWEVLLRPQDNFTGRTIWSKLCRRTFVEDIRTGNYKYAQDVDFSIKLYNKNPKAVFVNNILYYWLTRSSSTIHKKDYKLISSQCVSRIVYNNYKLMTSDLTINRRFLLEYLYVSMAIWLEEAQGTEHIAFVRRECKTITNYTWMAYLMCKKPDSPKKRVKRLFRIRYNKMYHTIISLVSNG